ncbi:hypothetical protein EVAR_85693_1 [Eumeta japonica]|uniref:Uncharacterized protein n=1 Tax=Eumeta variegata TaxID=151549 RepID=A0A4C1W9L9_EUMVA|nr:hypothetical protein EVAR_85693_1 [Eumeta japonica]
MDVVTGAGSRRRAPHPRPKSAAGGADVNPLIRLEKLIRKRSPLDVLQTKQNSPHISVIMSLRRARARRRRLFLYVQRRARSLGQCGRPPELWGGAARAGYRVAFIVIFRRSVADGRRPPVT